MTSKCLSDTTLVAFVKNLQGLARSLSVFFSDLPILPRKYLCVSRYELHLITPAEQRTGVGRHWCERNLENPYREHDKS